MPRAPHPATSPTHPRTEGLERALAVVGDRWTLAVVDALRDGRARFGALATAVPGIASNILARRLVDLERAGLVTKQPYSSRPPRFAYSLTEAGHDLAVVLASLNSWGARFANTGDAPHHDACGSDLEWHPWCPTCERVVGDDEAGELSWA